MKKPGYKTSEFWFTLVSFIFSGLYLIGVIGDSAYKDDLIRDVSHAVESVILIVGQLIIVFNYIKARDHVKTKETTEVEVVDLPSPVITKEKKNERKPRSKKSTNKPRTNSTRSRKTNSGN